MPGLGRAERRPGGEGLAEALRDCPADSVCSLRSVGENIQLLVDRPDGTYCFRLHKDRVYYVRSAGPAGGQSREAKEGRGAAFERECSPLCVTVDKPGLEGKFLYVL